MRSAAAILLLAGAALPSAAMARPADCLLSVKGKPYIDGRCDFEADPDGSFRLFGEKYFAYVNMIETGKAEASWNEDPKSTHAQAPLGELQRKGACWESATVKICAWGLGERPRGAGAGPAAAVAEAPPAAPPPAPEKPARNDAGASKPRVSDYAAHGDWKVEYLAVGGKNGAGEYCQATKIYASENALRFTADYKNSTIDFMGESTGALGKAVKATYWVDRRDGAEQKTTARLVTDPEGVEWLRIVETNDEPGSQDGLANGKTFTVAAGAHTWSYALTGTNPVLKSLYNCLDEKVRKLK